MKKEVMESYWRSNVEARPSPLVCLVFGLIFSRYCLSRVFEPVSIFWLQVRFLVFHPRLYLCVCCFNTFYVVHE